MKATALSEWKICTLAEVIEKFIDYRGKTPEKKNSGVPLITAKVVKDGKLLPPNEFIAAEDYNAWMCRGLPEINDVVLTTEAPLGEVALIKDKHVALAQRIITLRGKPEHVFNPYVKYYFQDAVGQNELQSRASGTTVFGIKASVLRDVPIQIPPLSEQRAIASVLSSLDDKIDLLQRQNKTLEAMAETLFRQWFVEEGNNSSWPAKRISDVIDNVQYGFTQSATDDIVGPKFLRITDIQGGVVNWDSVPYCLADEIETKKYKLEHGDIVIARTGASTGENYFCYKPENAVFASYLVRLKCSTNELARFIAMHTRSVEYREYIDGILSGSAQPNANAQELTSFEIAVPPDSILSKFYLSLSPLDEKRYRNGIQIRTLEKLRDTLLPKLMSGEVRVQYDEDH
jgi:type I restriction enzyme S subunit